SQSGTKRKLGDVMNDQEEMEGLEPQDEMMASQRTPTRTRYDDNLSGSAASAAQSSSNPDSQPTWQSRKEKTNAAILRNMPLAERARPTSLEDFIGQQGLVGPGGILRALVLQDTVPSIILWGPCGVGKTTLARIIAHTTKAQFKELSATTHNVADVRYDKTPPQIYKRQSDGSIFGYS
ncbi:DNA-dependent ATPase mgs1, partial [Lunasporangiospora selenospora]